MDGALSSSRVYDSNSSNNRSYQHQRRDNRRGGRGGGGRRGRGKYQPYYNRRGGGRGYHDRGGGRGYHDRGGGGRQRERQPANRFDNSAVGTTSIDPQTEMLRNLTAMVAKMGDLIACAESMDGNATTAAGSASVLTEESNSGTAATATESGEARGVVKAVANNIQGLVDVLCNPANAHMFLAYTPTNETATTGTTSNAEESTNEMQEQSNDNDKNNSTIQASEEAGPLATLLTSCAATLPLQSPSYAGLTLGMEEHAPDLSNDSQEQPNGDAADAKASAGTGKNYEGFGQRCVTMVCRRFKHDLDLMCGVTSLLEDHTTNSDNNMSTVLSKIPVEEDENDALQPFNEGFVHAFMRCKLLLRYMSLLARISIISGFDEMKDMNTDDDTKMELASLTIAGMLKALVTAAMNAHQKAKATSESTKAASESFENTSILLCTLVLSTIPYTVHFIPHEFIQNLLKDINSILHSHSYKSKYTPGSGVLAILLEKEIQEEGEDGSDDDDEEEDDDEDEDAAPPCTDTLLDLLRTIRKLVDTFYSTSTSSTSTSSSSVMGTRFSLLVDAPWKYLQGKEQEYAPMEGDEDDAMMKQKEQALRLRYSGTQNLISLESCSLLSYLFSLNDESGNGNGGDQIVDGVSISSTLALRCQSLDGIIFGRISLFGPPPEDDNDEDDDDDDDEAEGEAKNPHVDAYVKTFSLMDRYFLSESVRDCLICHKSSVSPSGLERGTCKDVVRQIWSVCHLFLPAKQQETDSSSNDNNMGDGNGEDQSGSLGQTPNAMMGVEYGIVETILSLIIQSPRSIESTSPLSHVYLSRVLIELTKYQPLRVPQCLVVAVATIFNDFIPSLSPLAKENMSQWLAFHLTNTEYQWPTAYWNVWTPYVVDPSSDESLTVKRNCRGEFLMHTIQCMSLYIPTPDLLMKQCLPHESKLCDFILGKPRHTLIAKSSSAHSNSIQGIEKDLDERIWVQNEDPDVIEEYIVGDEVSESVQSDLDEIAESSNPDKIWWRTGVVIRSLLRPARREKQYMERIIEETKSGDDMIESMDNDNDLDIKEDAIRDFADILPRFRPVVLATLAQDIKVHEENLDLRGEAKKSESEMLLSGELFLLMQLELVASFSSTMLKSYIATLLKHELVSPKAVICWSLGEFGYDALQHTILKDWWNHASSAMRIGIDVSLKKMSSSPEMLNADVGMIIDTGGDDEDGAKAVTPSVQRMKQLTDYTQLLMRYASNRVQKILDDHNSPAGKMNHEAADLKEGLKYFNRSVFCHVKSTLLEDPIVRSTTELGGAALEIETFLANNVTWG